MNKLQHDWCELIKDTVAKEVSSSISATSLDSTNVNILNGNFGASASKNLIHPVLVTNSYGVGISVTPAKYSSIALGLQCKATDTYSIGVLTYADDVSETPFNVLSNGQIQYTKAFFLQRKTGETSSNIYMYSTNKATGGLLTVQQDTTLTCCGGTSGSTNTGNGT